MRAFLADPEQHNYYRLLANLCVPIVDMGYFGKDKTAFDLVSRANRDFNAVADMMKVRRLLGKRGVEWSAGAGRAVFVFEPTDYVVPAGMVLRDVTGGREVTGPPGGRVTLARYHTYRMSPKAK